MFTSQLLHWGEFALVSRARTARQIRPCKMTRVRASVRNAKNPLLISFKLLCSHCNIFGAAPVFLPPPHIARAQIARIVCWIQSIWQIAHVYVRRCHTIHALRCVSLAWIKQTNGHFGCACECTVRLYTIDIREAHTEEILTLEIYILFSRSTPHSECYLFRFPYRTLFYMFFCCWLVDCRCRCGCAHPIIGIFIT